MTYHPTPRLSGSILYTVIAVFSLTLITACGGGGIKLDVNLSTPESRLIARCLTNPFTAECNTPTPSNTARNAKTFADARKGFITGCVEDATLTPELCVTATTFVCEGNTNDAEDTGNPFAPLCQTDDNSATYELARTSTISTCLGPTGDLTSDFCLNAVNVTCVDDAERTANPDLCAGFATDQTVINTCDSDIFNSACDGNPTYISQRNAHCTTSASDPRCDAVISNVCTFVASTDANNDNSTGNPFNTLCRTPANSATYEMSRNDIITACTTDLRGRLCTTATTFACTANPFHALCYDPTATVFQTARQTAVANCADSTTTITEQICTDAVAETCDGASADVFNALCSAYSGQPAQTAACGANPPADSRCYFQEQIDACAEGSEISRCAQIGTGDISTCAADPFAAACVAADSTFKNYLVDAQGKRYTYCSAEGRSATDPVCASYRACVAAPTTAGCGSNFDATLQATCEATPFNPQCTSSIYDSGKQEFCSINTPASDPPVNNLFHGNCTADYQDASARNTFCLADPFHANCNANTAYAEARIANCEGGSPHAKCITAAEHFKSPPKKPRTAVTTAKFTNSYLNIGLEDDGTITPIVGTLVTTTPTERELPLPEDAEEDAEPEIVIDQVETFADETPTIQNADIVRRGGGDADSNDDGYAFFQLVRPEAEGQTVAEHLRTSYHAAILPDTNLGAPLVGAPTVAIWPGHFSTLRTANVNGEGAVTITAQTAVDFYVNWATKKIGFVNPTRDGIGVHPTAQSEIDNRPQVARTGQIRLNVSFTEGGILSGDATVADTGGTNVLNVFGLIGQEGVVAIFLPRLGHLAGAGGFTASNPDHRTYVAPVVENSNAGNEAADDNASLVTYQDWVGTFAPKASPTTPRISEILQTSTSTGGRRISGLTNGQNALIRDFSLADFRSQLLKGNAKNGFAVFAESNNYYAGILHTTDLGAPITTPSGQALWRGEFSVQETQDTSGDSEGRTTRPFNLTVTFGSAVPGQAGRISAPIRDGLAELDTLLYDIDGSFNGQGVISGTAVKQEGQIRASLSGIIGQKGAVGVFVSDAENNKFAGGFVAVPNTAINANYDIWARSVPITPGAGFETTPKAYNHWLAGGVATSAGGLNGQSRAGVSLDANGAGSGIIRLSDATWRLEPFGGSAGNGVAFYTGTFNEAGRRQFYSGLFAQTDLGKPVTRTEGRAYWAGHLAAIQGAGGQLAGRNSGDIVIIVNFTPEGGNFTGALLANATTSINYQYEISGNFNEDGFLRGNVNTRSGHALQFFEQGFLTGLIGEQGMVGAFVAPNVSGGFVAAPTAPIKVGRVDYQDFVDHVEGLRGRTPFASVPHNEATRYNEILLTGNTAPYHISYGNSRQDDGHARFSYRVEDVWSDNRPAGLTGGYSMLHSVWNHPRHPAEAEKDSPLQRTYHAGIHPDTDVGLVRPKVPLGPGSTATWTGRMNIVGNKTFDYAKTTGSGAPIDFITNEEFKIQVNFNSSRINTPNHSFNRNRIGGYMYDLEANWDERGVIINGTINNSHADFPNATVSGIVGRNGVVAVIISNYNRKYGYSGGFIARP